MRVTSREIMYALKIKNVKTLTRWYQAGVIPEPSIELHPDGHGTMAYWPSWVLDHCRVIKQMTDAGQTINEVVGTFGKNWDAIAARYRVYNFGRVSEKMDRDQLLMNIWNAVDKTVSKHFANIRRRLDTTQFPPVTRDVVLQALVLIEKGFNPVLILHPERIVAVPDFLLSLHLASDYQNSDPFLVVPMFSIVMQHKLKTKLAKKPTIRPVSRVTRAKNGEAEEAAIISTEWDFQIQEESE